MIYRIFSKGFFAFFFGCFIAISVFGMGSDLHVDIVQNSYRSQVGSPISIAHLEKLSRDCQGSSADDYRGSFYSKLKSKPESLIEKITSAALSNSKPKKTLTVILSPHGITDDVKMISEKIGQSCGENPYIFIPDDKKIPQDYDMTLYHIRTFTNYYNGAIAVDLWHLKQSYSLNIIYSHENDVYRGLHFMTTGGILSWREKVSMKETIRKGSLRTPEFSLIKYSTDLLDFVMENCYELGGDFHSQENFDTPLVVKKNFGVGTQDTLLFRDFGQLNLFLKESMDLTHLPQSSLIAETFMGDGKGNSLPMYHIDGFVKKGGEFLFAHPSVYDQTTLDCVGGNILSTRILPFDDFSGYLISYAKKVIEIMPTLQQGGAFHLEIFYDHSKNRSYTTFEDIIFCEISSRPGGLCISHQYQNALGLSLVHEHLNIQAGFGLSMIPQSLLCFSGSIFFPSSLGYFPQDVTPNLQEFPFLREFKRYDENVYDQTRVKGSISDLSAWAVVVGDTSEELIENITLFKDWFLKALYYYALTECSDV